MHEAEKTLAAGLKKADQADRVQIPKSQEGEYTLSKLSPYLKEAAEQDAQAKRALEELKRKMAAKEEEEDRKKALDEVRIKDGEKYWLNNPNQSYEEFVY